MRGACSRARHDQSGEPSPLTTHERARAPLAHGWARLASEPIGGNAHQRYHSPAGMSPAAGRCGFRFASSEGSPYGNELRGFFRMVPSAGCATRSMARPDNALCLTGAAARRSGRRNGTLTACSVQGDWPARGRMTSCAFSQFVKWTTWK